MTFAAFCWAGAFIAGKIGAATVSGVEMSFYRFLIAALCLLCFGLVRKVSFKLPLKRILALMGVGVFGMIGYHLLFFESLKTIGVLEASAINTLNPVLSAILALAIFKEPLNRKGVIYLLLASFGVLTVVVNWDFAEILSMGEGIGTMQMLAAMTIWVLYSLMIKKIAAGVSPIVSTFYTLFGATLVLLPFILMGGVNPFSYTLNVWGVYLFMGVFSTFLGYTLQQDSILKIGVSRTNFFINFVPVFSMIMGVLILNDPFYPLSIVSLMIIAVGLLGYLHEKEQLVAVLGD